MRPHSENIFVGKRVGILPGTNTEKIYQLLLLHNKVPRDQIHEERTPFELATFIAGNYDVRPAFVYDEPIALARAKVDVNIINQSDFGTKFIGTVYFTKKSTVRNDRALVLNVVKSLIPGWQEVGKPRGVEAAVKELKARYPEIDEDRESRSLKAGLPYFMGTGGDKPLTATDESWNAMISSLREIGALNERAFRVAEV